MVASEETYLIGDKNRKDDSRVSPSVVKVPQRIMFAVLMIAIAGLMIHLSSNYSNVHSEMAISSLPCDSRPDKLDECELNNEYIRKEDMTKGDWLFQHDNNNGTESEWPSKPDLNADIDFDSLNSLGYLQYVDTSREPMGVCLDGSTPAYWLRRGFGKGQTKWLIHLKGGGWCTSHEDCESWVTSQAVNTSLLAPNMTFGGIMSIDPKYNPDFFDWNVVYVWYCDGASYSGFVEQPYVTHRGVKLYFRGRSVLRSVLKDLMWTKSMSMASEVFLTGTSAGGLGVLHQCDLVRELVLKTGTEEVDKEDEYSGKQSDSENTLTWMEQQMNVISTQVGGKTQEGGLVIKGADKKFKCLSDAGWFIDTMNWEGHYSHGHLFENVTKIQNVTANLNDLCTSKFPEKDSWRCFFPMNSFKYITTPTFIINSAIDYYQMTNFFFYHSTSGYKCVTYPLKECNAEMFAKIQDFREAFMETTSSVRESTKHGSFIDICMAHAQSTRNKLFYLPQINNVTMSEAIREWYYKDDMVKAHIDERAWPYIGQVCDWGPTYDDFVENNGFLISQSSFVTEVLSGKESFDLQEELSSRSQGRAYNDFEPTIF